MKKWPHLEGLDWDGPPTRRPLRKGVEQVARGVAHTQRAQYPSIQEYTVNDNGIPNMI